MMKAPSLEKKQFACALNARGPKHVGLTENESFGVFSHDGTVMAIVLRGTAVRPDLKQALSLLARAHERCAKRWPFGCEADLIPDFERIQAALKQPIFAASVAVVEGFTIHRIGFRGDDTCV